MLGLHGLGVAGRVRLLKRVLLCTACERMGVSAGNKVPSEYRYALQAHLGSNLGAQACMQLDRGIVLLLGCR